MAKRVLLHIGASKTGTTYLQGLMHANRGVLAEHGVLFPHPLLDHFRFMLCALDRLHDIRRPQIAHTAFDRVVAAVQDWDGTAVVSNELLAAATPAQVARVVSAFSPADVHVVYTVRDLARTLPAEWQQAVKGGYPATMEEFVSQVMETFTAALTEMPNVVGESQVVPKFAVLHRVDQVTERWATAVRPDNIHVVTLPPAGADRSLLWKRFSSVVGVEPEIARKPPRRSNESLGVAEAELLRRVNEMLEAAGDHDFLAREWVRRNFVLPILMPRPAHQTIAIAPEAHQWARERARDLIEHLSRSPYRIVGDLDDLMPTEQPRPGLRPREVAEIDVSEAAVASVAALLRELRQRGESRQDERP